MKTIELWLNEYNENHQHPTNKAVHFLSIPLIVMGVIGMIWHYSLPALALVLLLYFIFILVLSKPMLVGMVVFMALELGAVFWIDRRVQIPLHIFCFVLFVFGWIFQFLGHKIEGRKPAFLRNMVMLLIGPVFVLAPFYRLLKVRL